LIQHQRGGLNTTKANILGIALQASFRGSMVRFIISDVVLTFSVRGKRTTRLISSSGGWNPKSLTDGAFCTAVAHAEDDFHSESVLRLVDQQAMSITKKSNNKLRSKRF
jgi:hypothetical protein